MKTTLAEKAEKAAAAFCAAAATLTLEVRAAGVAARKAARAAQAAREVAARAENLLDEYTPNPDGAGPTWEAVLAAHMALDTATRVALQAADQAAKLA